MDVFDLLSALSHMLPEPLRAVVSIAVLAVFITSFVVANLKLVAADDKHFGWLVRLGHRISAARFFDEKGSLKLPGQGVRRDNQ